MKTRFFTSLGFASLLILAPFAAQGDEEQDLIGVLKSDAGAPQKCDACQQLRLIGTVKSVPALAALLNQPSIAQAARYALEGMPFPESAAALRDALASSSGPIKSGLIDSLGWRRDAEAVPQLRTALSDADSSSRPRPRPDPGSGQLQQSGSRSRRI